MSDMWVPQKVFEDELADIMREDDPRLRRFQNQTTTMEDDDSDWWPDTKAKVKKQQLPDQFFPESLQKRGLIPDWMKVVKEEEKKERSINANIMIHIYAFQTLGQLINITCRLSRTDRGILTQDRQLQQPRVLMIKFDEDLPIKHVNLLYYLKLCTGLMLEISDFSKVQQQYVINDIIQYQHLMKDHIQAFLLYAGTKRETIDYELRWAFKKFDLKNINKVRLVILRDPDRKYQRKARRLLEFFRFCNTLYFDKVSDNPLTYFRIDPMKLVNIKQIVYKARRQFQPDIEFLEIFKNAKSLDLTIKTFCILSWFHLEFARFQNLENLSIACNEEHFFKSSRLSKKFGIKFKKLTITIPAFEFKANHIFKYGLGLRIPEFIVNVDLLRCTLKENIHAQHTRINFKQIKVPATIFVEGQELQLILREIDGNFRTHFRFLLKRPQNHHFCKERYISIYANQIQ